jgi:hypothetical protein
LFLLFRSLETISKTLICSSELFIDKVAPEKLFLLYSFTEDIIKAFRISNLLFIIISLFSFSSFSDNKDSVLFSTNGISHFNFPEEVFITFQVLITSVLVNTNQVFSIVFPLQDSAQLLVKSLNDPDKLVLSFIKESLFSIQDIEFIFPEESEVTILSELLFTHILSTFIGAVSSVELLNKEQEDKESKREPTIIVFLIFLFIF